MLLLKNGSFKNKNDKFYLVMTKPNQYFLFKSFNIKKKSSIIR